MARTEFWGLIAPSLLPGPVLNAYHDGVAAITGLAARFAGDGWNCATPCPEWRAADLAGHLRCVADDYNEYLDDAPASRLARLMATGAHPETLERKLARQNAAELAALPDVPAAENIAAFAESARHYASRLAGVWDLPHHRYRDAVVTVAGMAGVACAEWHLHAWDLARALGLDYRPADPDVLLAGWRVGLPHLQARLPHGYGERGLAVPGEPWRDPRRTRPRGRAWHGLRHGGAWHGLRHGRAWREVLRGGAWHTLLVASGRSPDWCA